MLRLLVLASSFRVCLVIWSLGFMVLFSKEVVVSNYYRELRKPFLLFLEVMERGWKRCDYDEISPFIF